ncbi:MAG: S8 family serine peptidase, partial [bacterium]
VWDRTNPPPGPFTGIAFILSTGISDDTQDLNIDADLSENFASGGDWPYWRDLHGEGTHVAGTIAAINNNIGVVGVAPGTTVVAVRVLDAQGNGLLSNAISGVEYAYSKAKKG